MKTDAKFGMKFFQFFLLFFHDFNEFFQDLWLNFYSG